MKMSEPVKVAAASAITFLMLVGTWSVASYLLGMPEEIIPKPHQLLQAVWQGWFQGTMWVHVAATLKAALGGFGLGCAMGLALGMLLAEVEPLRRSVYPLLTGLQSVPLVAIAPLIVTAVGFGTTSKVIIAALFTFFPILVNLIAALNSARPELVDLYRASRASRWRILLNVKLPTAASAAFAAMQIGFALSLIGAVVGEFIASNAGLGYLIKSKAGELDVAMAFAATLTLAVIGASGVQTLRFLHRRVVFWEAGHAVERS